MSLTPSKVTWDPNRYKATEYVITYDSNGTPTLSKKEADYTGVNYNFSSLPSGTTTQTTTGTTTQQTGTTTQAQTAEAFGNVKPYYWNQGGGGNGGNQNQEIIKTSPKQQPQLSGFFDPLDKAISGEPVGSLGMRVKQKFEDITGKTERDWEDVDRDIEIDRINAELAKGGLDYDEEATLRNKLSELQKQSTTGFFTKPKDLAKKTYEKTGLKKAIDFLKPFPIKIAEAMMDPLQKSTNSFNKNYFSQTNGIYENGRIAGNPSTDLYAGMNAQSMTGNLNLAGAKRIATREKTIATKNVSDKFKKDTENMKDQHREYLENKAADRDRKSGGNTTTNVTGHGKSGFGRDTSQGAGDTGQGSGCVVATHAVNSGAFTPEIKREAVRWCIKNLHRTWWGEAIRRGYRYYGQKAINEGKAKNHYQEFKNYVAFGTGRKRNLKTAWTFIYRTIQFFIKGVIIKK